MYIYYDLPNGMTLEFCLDSDWFKRDQTLDFAALHVRGTIHRVSNPRDENDYYTPAIQLVRDNEGRLVIDLSFLKDLRFYTHELGADGRTSEKVRTFPIVSPYYGTIRFDFYRKSTMAEIAEKLNRHEHVIDDELILAMIRDGVHNVRIMTQCSRLETFALGFGIGVTDHDSARPMECGIDESQYNRSLLDNYRIVLEPISPVQEDGLYTGRDYYTMDFMSLLIRCPDYKILPSIGDQSWDHTREYFESHGIDI